MNFSVAVTKRNANEKDVTAIASFMTNSVLELSQYIGETVTYFEGMVRFDSNVNYVGLLVRCYKDHHVISIQRDDSGNVKAHTNQ